MPCPSYFLWVDDYYADVADDDGDDNGYDDYDDDDNNNDDTELWNWNAYFEQARKHAVPRPTKRRVTDAVAGNSVMTTMGVSNSVMALSAVLICTTDAEMKRALNKYNSCPLSTWSWLIHGTLLG